MLGKRLSEGSEILSPLRGRSSGQLDLYRNERARRLAGSSSYSANSKVDLN